MEQRILDIFIEDISDKGEGIGRSDGLVVFVPGTLPGDKARVRVTEDKGRFLKAALLEILEPSPDRVEPPCPYAAECGGCPLIGLSYAAQLKIKEKHVRDALTRLGRLSAPLLRPIIGMDDPRRYRNKAEFALQGDRDGYCKRGTQHLL